MRHARFWRRARERHPSLHSMIMSILLNRAYKRKMGLSSTMERGWIVRACSFCDSLVPPNLVLYLSIPHKRLPLPDRLGKNLAQVVLVERLLDHEVDAALARLLVAELAPPAGDQHGRDSTVALFDLRQQLPAVHIGHAKVGDHQVVGVGGEHLERLGAVGGLRDVVAPAREQP